MRHQVAGRKLKRTHSHRKALLHNLATQLFEHKKVHTTEAKAKELRPFAERLITKAKHALLKEKMGELPSGQTIDIHNRRQVGRVIRDKAVLQELFDSIAPVVESRNGGFTRVIKTGVRRGDNARTAVIELVDYAAEQDGATSMKRKKKQTKKQDAKPQGSVAKPTVAPVDNAVVAEEAVPEVVESVAVENIVAEGTTSETLVFEDTSDASSETAPEANDSNDVKDKSEENNL